MKDETKKKRERKKDEAEEKVTTKSSFRRTCLNLYRAGVGRDVLRQWGNLYGEIKRRCLQMHACDRVACISLARRFN